MIIVYTQDEETVLYEDWQLHDIIMKMERALLIMILNGQQTHRCIHISIQTEEVSKWKAERSVFKDE